MATLGATALTYADWAKRLDDNYRIAMIIELLSQTNEILDDMMVVEGNLPTGHKTTVRTGLPQATWRLLNDGVPNAKSTTAQIVDTVGNLETYSVIDKDVADLNGNTAEFRLSEVKAFLEGMSQQVAATLIYGNQFTNPERFTGLAPRYSTLTAASSQTAANVLNAGGSASTNTSIWIGVWGSDTLHATFPKGKITGLQHRDMGEWPVTGANGGTYQAYRDHFKWEIGLVLRDWRYVARIANIDVTQLTGVAAANLINLVVRALYRLPTAPVSATTIQTSDTPEVRANMGRTVIYCNRVIRTYLDLQAMNKTNVLLRIEEFDGKPVTTFRGIPVRTCDAILNNEATVSYMILDSLLQFTASTTGDTPTAQTTTASTNVIDLHMAGIPVLANLQGARDMGIGDDPALKLLVQVKTAFTSGGAATLQIAVQGATDDGTGAPSTYSTWWTSPAYALATVAVAGARLLDMDFPRPPAGIAIPRFVRLAWIIGSTTMTGGALQAFLVLDRHDQPYSSTGNAVLGGYPAGITVAN